MVHAKFNSCHELGAPGSQLRLNLGLGSPGIFLGESRVQIIKALRQFAFTAFLSKKTNCSRSLSGVARGAAPKCIT